MGYLTYVIDHYDTLPAIIAFLHAHEIAEHADTPNNSNAEALRMLKLNWVKKNGYVNLRCNPDPGCFTKNPHITPDIYIEMFTGTSTDVNRTATYTGIRNIEVPLRVGQACCAQFAVTRERVRQRPKSDYELFRQWLLDTALDDAKSGRIFEYLWHIIFGMRAV